MAAYDSREYVGSAPATTLASGIDAVVASITLTDGTNWPTGATGNFHITIDRGLSNEERIKCSARTGNVLSVVGSGRGVDNTVAAPHGQNAIVEHTLAAIDLSEANQHYANTALDHHTQLLNVARHDVSTRHVFGSALANPAAATTSAVGQAAGAGAATGPSRADHTHGRESFGTPVVTALANAAGSAPTIPRSDHVHQGPGTLGFAQVTANQGSITTVVDLTGLAITVTVASARRIRISAQLVFQSTVAGDVVELDLNEGATSLTASAIPLPLANVGYGMSLIYVATPTAASHTYKLRALRGGGTGTITMLASATLQAMILVEDIGV